MTRSFMLISHARILGSKDFAILITMVLFCAVAFLLLITVYMGAMLLTIWPKAYKLCCSHTPKTIQEAEGLIKICQQFEKLEPFYDFMGIKAEMKSINSASRKYE